MTGRDFVYWLQGFFEMVDPETLTPKQIDLIRRHLNLVFIHEIDPAAGPPDKQAILDAAHNGAEYNAKQPDYPGADTFQGFPPPAWKQEPDGGNNPPKKRPPTSTPRC